MKRRLSKILNEIIELVSSYNAYARTRTYGREEAYTRLDNMDALKASIYEDLDEVRAESGEIWCISIADGLISRVCRLDCDGNIEKVLVEIE